MSQFSEVKDGQVPDGEIPNLIGQNYQDFGYDLQLTFSQNAPVN